MSRGNEDRDPREQPDGGSDDIGGCALAVVLTVLAVPFVIVSALVAGASWWHERDLRDLQDLERTTARVVDVDDGRKWSRDEYRLAFTALDGTAVSTEVPVDTATSFETELEIAYVPNKPFRVRTVDDWQPLYEQAVLVVVIAIAVSPLLVAWVAYRTWRRRRRGQPHVGAQAES